MKKALLGTTALVGASLALAGMHSPADAQVKISVHGKVDFQVGFISKDFEGFPHAINGISSSSADRGFAFITDSELNIHGDGKTRSGMHWRAVLELEADGSNSGGSPNKRVADDTHLRLWGSWGMTILGTEDGVADMMHQHSGYSAYGHRTGDGSSGVNGSWKWWMFDRSFLGDGRFAEPKVLDSGDGTKIAYFTPRAAGFQAGISYAPEGRASEGSSRSNTLQSDKNFVEWGVNYKAKHSDVGIHASVVGSLADTGDANFRRESTSTVAVGSNFTYGGWSTGLAYGTNGDSAQPKTAFVSVGDAQDVEWWDVAVGYGRGPFGVRLTFYQSIVEKFAVPGEDTQNVYIVGSTYKLGKGMQVYGDLVFAGTHTDNPADKPLETDGVA